MDRRRLAPLCTGSLVAGAGAALVVGIVAWRLSGTTVRADVGTICDAETRSGFTLRRDMAALTDWIRGRLVTPEGNEIFASLGDLPMAERSARLRVAADTVGIPSCPMVRTYDELVAEGDDRAELQRLCSYVTFPDLASLDDDGRLDVLEDWIANVAVRSRTKALALPMRTAETPADRAHVLRAASAAIDILTCDIAKTLESPPSPASE